MGGISPDHAEWAVVDRMRQMMEEPKGDYLATQTYAMFTAILCWVLQHMRIREGQQENARDRAASILWAKLEAEDALSEPWFFPVKENERSEKVGAMMVNVPASDGFEQHKAGRLLTNLRNAVAHGDARKVRPFNVHDRLVGFTFSCNEKGSHWRGEITLLRADMRRIGGLLVTRYRDAVMVAGREMHGPSFREVAEALRDADNDLLATPDERAAG